MICSDNLDKVFRTVGCQVTLAQMSIKGKIYQLKPCASEGIFIAVGDKVMLGGKTKIYDIMLTLHHGFDKNRGLDSPFLQTPMAKAPSNHPSPNERFHILASKIIWQHITTVVLICRKMLRHFFMSYDERYYPEEMYLLLA
ncbi:hypothetical protein CHS0354_002700 [Potamilus streckersoni]|uniref:Uncharacterized protein n=1 Tax=Potamilus streckersoni TaxID=2493646 RepID=A0AAE0RVT7_9BIVA|nr:hypothetical protein CHS0354_002700 [Potamilus streckersoni]